MYDCMDSCNFCGGTNNVVSKVMDAGLIEEAETICTVCGARDYWAYGFFESGENGHDRCKKYGGREGGVHG